MKRLLCGALTLAFVSSAGAAGFPVWDRKSLCEYVYHKQVEGWTVAQLRDLARANNVPERVIRWAEKNC